MAQVAELLLARGSRLNSAPRRLEPIILPDVDEISEPDFVLCAEHLSAEGVGYVIAYTDEAEQLSVRRISAKRVLESTQGKIYIRGYCFERQEPRCFKLEFISRLMDAETGELIDDPHEHFIDRLNDDMAAAQEQRAWTMANKRVKDGARILVFLARCDGQFSLEEREPIRRYIRKCCEEAIGDEIEPEKLDRLMDWAVKQAPDYSLFAECVHKIWAPRASKWHQNLIMAGIRDVLDADGVLANEEVEFFLELQALSRD